MKNVLAPHGIGRAPTLKRLRGLQQTKGFVLWVPNLTGSVTHCWGKPSSQQCDLSEVSGWVHLVFLVATHLHPLACSMLSPVATLSRQQPHLPWAQV